MKFILKSYIDNDLHHIWFAHLRLAEHLYVEGTDVQPLAMCFYSKTEN